MMKGANGNSAPCLHAGGRRYGHGETVRKWLQSDHHLTIRGSQPQLQEHVQAQTLAGEMAERCRCVFLSLFSLVFHVCILYDSCYVCVCVTETMAIDNMLPSPSSLSSPLLGFEGLPGRRRKKRTSIETNVRIALERNFISVSRIHEQHTHTVDLEHTKDFNFLLQKSHFVQMTRSFYLLYSVQHTSASWPPFCCLMIKKILVLFLKMLNPFFSLSGETEVYQQTNLLLYTV